MSAATAPMAPPPRLDSVLSFGDAMASPDEAQRPSADARAFSDASNDDDDDDDDAGGFEFEFAFAPPLTAPGGGLGVGVAPADDLFAHGLIVPAYPVFDRHLLDEATSAAPPSPAADTYCEWAPRSAPGSPSRASFPKSASAGEARRHWRLRDLVALGGGRSHSDGKEKFVFLQPRSAAAAAPPSSKAPGPGAGTDTTRPQQKQSKKKAAAAAKASAATEMDMTTAHRLFYGKQKQQGAGGDRRPQQSYLPYRPGIVGFFATAHALGRSHHPY